MALSRPMPMVNAFLQMRLFGQRSSSLSASRRSWPCLQQTSSTSPISPFLQLHIRLQITQSRNASSRSHPVHAQPRPSYVPSVTVTVGAWQTRSQSTAPRNDDGEDAHGRPPRPPPPPRGRVPIFRLLVQALGGSLRSIFTPFQGQTLKTLYRSNPGELVLALAILVASVFVVAYVARIYFTYFNSRQFTRYPPPVAKYLRRALYFSNYSPDPKRALRNYKLALEQCDALGLDPFSDDVLGIRIQLASWLEQIGNYDAAIKILELLLADCRRWVDLMEKDGKAGTASLVGSDGLSPRLPPRTANKSEAKDDKDVLAESETLWGRRSRILRKAIGISVKLGQLYADEHVLNTDMAHERLVWSVDTALQEFQRRSAEGPKAGEGEWMSPVEMGAALESLAHSYESRSQFHLALPLFFQALRVSSDPCHSAVIMNNLAISFAQHPVQPPYETLVGSVIDKPASGVPITQQEAQRAFYETAQRWAQNAHQHARDTSGDARTPECDHACAVALCNLGDIAALMGDVRAATQRFQEARAMSTAMGFDAGVQQADAGLARLPKL